MHTRRILPLLLVMAALPLTSQAQTYLSGPLSGTLTTDDYIVEGTISVANGESLTIESGAIFRFIGYYAFEIEGTLNANGTESDSIIFENDNQANPDGWHGLRFNGSGASGSELQYCRISGGQAQGSNFTDQGGGVYCDGAAPTFRHCLISDNSAPNFGGGVYLNNAPAMFEYCVVEHNETNYLGGGICAFTSNFSADFCRFDYNSAESGGGISASDAELLLTNSSLTGNYCSSSAGGLSLSGTPSAILENVLIYQNSAHGT